MFFFFFKNFILIFLFLLFCQITLSFFSFFFFKKRKFKFLYPYFLSFTLFFSYLLYFYSLFILFFFDWALLPYQLFLSINFFFFNFFFSLDSLSLLFILILTFLIPLSILLSFYHPLQITYIKRLFLNFPLSINPIFFISKFYISLFLLLILELTLFFLFISSNLFTFYLFFELCLFPIFFLIGLSGSRVKKITAIYYFFFFTLLGSLFFFFSISLIFYLYGTLSFYFLIFLKIPFKLQKLLWLCFFLTFAIKVPVFPFHFWLPEAHVESSTEGSVLLSGLLLKIGFFGFIKFLIPFFPKITLFFLPLIYTLAITTIIYISCIIFIQLDIKKIIAYSSIIHMNFALLGLFSGNILSIQGSLFLLIAHAFISPALFILIGFLYSRFNSRLLFYYQGLQNFYPVFSSYFFFFLLANIGFPGTSGFVGEYLILLGIFLYNPFIGFLSLFSFLFSAIYSLLLFLKIFHGISFNSSSLFYKTITFK